MHCYYFSVIITYQVITGNYSFRSLVFPCSDIITYQVITGNYSSLDPGEGNMCDYNIPSNNRELQHRIRTYMHYLNYNIPSNNRELQLIGSNLRVLYDYNIPSNNRELQPGMRMHCGHSIITYQVITGNYSCVPRA